MRRASRNIYFVDLSVESSFKFRTLLCFHWRLKVSSFFNKHLFLRSPRKNKKLVEYHDCFTSTNLILQEQLCVMTRVNGKISIIQIQSIHRPRRNGKISIIQIQSIHRPRRTGKISSKSPQKWHKPQVLILSLYCKISYLNQTECRLIWF